MSRKGFTLMHTPVDPWLWFLVRVPFYILQAWGCVAPISSALSQHHLRGVVLPAGEGLEADMEWLGEAMGEATAAKLLVSCHDIAAIRVAFFSR